tara:strand:+ start:1505 stop:1708 length:204 start_codon:yes stop_codon:yes gene_type:complete
MARTPVISTETLKKIQPGGVLAVADQTLRSMFGEMVRLMRINNRHLEEMTGNALNEEDLVNDMFSQE